MVTNDVALGRNEYGYIRAMEKQDILIEKFKTENEALQTLKKELEEKLEDEQGARQAAEDTLALVRQDNDALKGDIEGLQKSQLSESEKEFYWGSKNDLILYRLYMLGNNEDFEATGAELAKQGINMKLFVDQQMETTNFLVTLCDEEKNIFKISAK